MSAMIVFLRKLWGFVRPYRGRFFIGLFCGIGYGMANGLLVASVNQVFKLVFEGKTSLHAQLARAPEWIHPLADWLRTHIPELRAPADGDRLGWALVIGMIPAVMILRNMLQYASVYFVNWSAVHAIADIRTKLFGHLQNLSLGFFNKARTGDLIARITSDTQALNVVVNNSLASMVKDPVTLLCLIGYNLITQPTLTLVSAIVFPVCIVPVVIYGRKVRKSAKKVQFHNAELASQMHEAFTGNRVIKAYNLETTITDQFKATIRKYAGQIMRVTRANELPGQFNELFASFGIALVFFYIVNMPAATRPDMGDISAFMLTMVLIYPSVKSLTKLHNQLHQARAASERVFELLATQNTIPEPVAPKMLHADQADIVFENVDFSFDDKPVLRNINLTVKAGQMVALVGASGSGKTTLTNLLLRFYDPVRGSIKIGGVDLREVRTRDLRNQIAVVAQENILFNDTIRRNIELGRIGAKEEEILAAAHHAYAYDFIMEKKEGFDAVVGEKGVSLSGGQRQRLAIARAVLKNAPVLVLDEATSALDTESERAVQSALDELMKGRTTLCIAHRLSTVLHADVIVVLDHGRIVETGRHEELVRRGGVYQKLYELQFAS
jgi:subfamily B ATP-binding cassette protein MsbA